MGEARLAIAPRYTSLRWGLVCGRLGEEQTAVANPNIERWAAEGANGCRDGATQCPLTLQLYRVHLFVLYKTSSRRRVTVSSHILSIVRPCFGQNCAECLHWLT